MFTMAAGALALGDACDWAGLVDATAGLACDTVWAAGAICVLLEMGMDIWKVLWASESHRPESQKLSRDGRLSSY